MLNQSPVIIRSVFEMRELAAAARASGKSAGLVPTMGALHAGHLSLVRRAAAENDLTVVSVFVNPIQFDDPADFTAYPQTLASDANAAGAAGADVIFAPGADEMYPTGFSTYIDMTGVSEKLCGAARENHFRGVLTVVGKLFGICAPDRAYFGEKDAQQLAVIQKMTAELCMNVHIIPCETVREPDGLAMSSRNERLSADERRAARVLFQALLKGKAMFDAGETDARALSEAVRAVIEEEPLARIEYTEIVDPLSLENAPRVRKGDLTMLAVHIGAVRLIDNLKL